MRTKLIKKKQIPALNISELISDAQKYLKEQFYSPLQIMNFVIENTISILIVMCYVLLILQTAKICSSSKKYQNLKNIMIKWMIFLIYLSIIENIQSTNLQINVIKSGSLLFLFLIIYPSRFSKKIFLKYSQNDKILNDNTEQISMQNIPLSHKFLVSFIVFLLRITKYILTFVHPDHRKSIQEQIKGINMIIIQQKYFWKIYDPSASRVHNNVIKEKIIVDPPISTKESIIQPSDFDNRQVKVEVATRQLRKPQFQQIQQKQKKKPVSNKKVHKYQVAQFLPLFNAKNRTNAYTGSSSRRCTYYRDIQISYNIQSAQMTVTSLQDMKISYHTLQQVIQLQQLMVQFKFQDNEQAIVKFNSKTELDKFIQQIDMHESNLQK